jgi:hypothetical protein
MQKGDKEGLNRIYDKSGQPILKQGEEIELNKEGTWKGYYIKSGLKYVNQFKTYRGQFFITNFRIIFIGKPKRLGRRALVAVSGVGKVSNMANFQAAREKLSDFREFFEIKFAEVTKVDPTPISVRIFGKDMRHKYRVEVPKNLESTLMLEYLAYTKTQ